MKKIYSILFLTVLLASCGEQKKNSVEKVLESNNLETIRKKRGELVNEQDAINEKIKLLDEKIATFDTVQHVPLITTITAKTEESKHV